MLIDEGFIVDDTKNYIIFANAHEGENLSSPARIHFYYTSKCNLNCAHCFTKKDNIGIEMTIDQKKNMVNQMTELGINEILIGGGEPFAKEDFHEFVQYCLDNSISTKVFTNGLLLTKRFNNEHDDYYDEPYDCKNMWIEHLERRYRHF